MEKSTFSFLVDRLGVLRKKDTNWRNAIPFEKRIAIALYTLGSSAEYRSIGDFLELHRTLCAKFSTNFAWHLCLSLPASSCILLQKKWTSVSKDLKQLDFPSV